MKQLAAAVLTLLAIPAMRLEAGFGALADVQHVVLISFDGLRPDFYLDESWPAPMLQQMRREGAHAAAVRVVFPSVTYPAHASLLTGVPPARHGIYYNEPFEPEGPSGKWYWQAEQIQVPTLWDAARTAGLLTASVFWPVSVGAPVDFNIPEIWPLDWKSEDFTAPMRRLARPAGLLEELEREATGRLSPLTFSFGRLDLDDRSAAMAAYLLAVHKPNLLTVHFVGADHFQHEQGRDGPLVRRAVAALDRCIARLVEAAEQVAILDRTTFVVAGDHGFIDLHTEVSPNVWLVEAGLMEARPDRGRWRATVHNASAAGFVHLADSEDSAALEMVRAILTSRPEAAQGLFQVLERPELDRLQSAPQAVLALAPAAGVYISDSYEPPAVRPKTGAGHGHLPDLPGTHTGLVVWGAGVRARAALPGLTLEQIAPLVGHLLGLELTGVSAPLAVELLDQRGTTPP